MPPVVHPFPVKRPGYIEQAAWLGTDEDLSLQLSFRNIAGNLETISFQTAGENPGEICLPSSTDLATLGPRVRDILAAHLRMGVMVAGHAVPGSREFEDVFVQTGTNNFQVAIGTAKVIASRMVSDSEIDIDWRIGSSGPIRTERFGHGELSNYVFVPQTQLLVVPGAVEKQFPNYVHSWPGTVLTQAQKDNVAAYVLTLEPWI